VIRRSENPCSPKNWCCFDKCYKCGEDRSFLAMIREIIYFCKKNCIDGLTLAGWVAGTPIRLAVSGASIVIGSAPTLLSQVPAWAGGASGAVPIGQDIQISQEKKILKICVVQEEKLPTPEGAIFHMLQKRLLERGAYGVKLHKIHESEVWNMTEPLRGVDPQWDLTIIQRKCPRTLDKKQLEQSVALIPGDKKIVVFVCKYTDSSIAAKPNLSWQPGKPGDFTYVFLGNQEGLHPTSGWQIQQERALVDYVLTL